jgi:HPt (histidine-containing phosphotransfer) domain-containing protein
MSHISRPVLADLMEVDPSGDLLRQMQGFFASLPPERFSGADEALELRDHQTLKGRLHALKNSFLNVGALGVAQECQDLENRVDESTEEEIRNGLAALKNRYSEVKIELGEVVTTLIFMSSPSL